MSISSGPARRPASMLPGGAFLLPGERARVTFVDSSSHTLQVEVIVAGGTVQFLWPSVGPGGARAAAGPGDSIVFHDSAGGSVVVVTESTERGVHVRWPADAQGVELPAGGGRSPRTVTVVLSSADGEGTAA